MKYLILLLLLTFNIHAAQRYNLVSNDLTMWTDEVYLIIDGDNMTMVTPDGIIHDGSILEEMANGASITIKNFVLTISSVDEDGNDQTMKFIEGIEYKSEKD